VLTSIYPGVTVEEVRAEVGWPLEARERLASVEPPNETELRLLREVLDPKKLYLG
jgi:glutaconate CoA-transferase subunit B